MTLTVNPRPLAFVVLSDENGLAWEYAVRTSDLPYWVDVFTLQRHHDPCPIPLGFVHIADDNGLVWEYAVHTSDPGCPPRPVVPVASAGPETGGVTGQGGAA